LGVHFIVARLIAQKQLAPIRRDLRDGGVARQRQLDELAQVGDVRFRFFVLVLVLAFAFAFAFALVFFVCAVFPFVLLGCFSCGGFVCLLFLLAAQVFGERSGGIETDGIGAGLVNVDEVIAGPAVEVDGIAGR